MSGTVELTTEGPIATVLIDNVDKRNALSTRMWIELGQRLRDASADAAVRIVILRGAGRSAFCAGGDIDELEQLTDDSRVRDAFVRSVEAAFAALLDSTVPVVAMLHGTTIGGGMLLACACDLRFADTELRMGIPASRLGIVPDTTEIEALASLAGPSRAAELLFTGRILTAAEALDWGLVDRVVSPDDLEREIFAFAGEVAGAAPQAVSTARRQLTSTRFSRTSGHSSGSVDALGGPELAEALRAMREGRKPVFPDRSIID